MSDKGGTMQTRSIRITYNGADLTDSIVRDALQQELAEVASRAFADSINKAIEDMLARVFDWPLKPVRTRVAPRQSCLWRHSFDWRNRKRGHVTHRGIK